MKPILLEKLRIFELKRQSKPIIEKDLLMWLHKRKYTLLVGEKRKKEAAELAKEEERMRKEEEKRKREVSVRTFLRTVCAVGADGMCIHVVRRGCAR